MYLTISHRPCHMNMVPRQHSNVVWATRIVIQYLRLWLRHMLPWLPLLLAIIFITHILLSLNIILQLMLHVRLIVLWLTLRLRLVVSITTACPATHTPVNSTVHLYLLPTLSTNRSMHN
jgi:hypothetical protein